MTKWLKLAAVGGGVYFTPTSLKGGRAGEMILPAKCLPCTRTQHPSQKLGVVVYTCNPRVKEAEVCRQSWGSLTYQLSLSDEFQDSEGDPILNKVLGMTLRLSSGHTHTHSHAHRGIRYSQIQSKSGVTHSIS